MHCSAGRKVKYRGRQEEATAMLTFSREQQNVEAAAAVFSHPPSLLSTSLIPSLLLSCFLPRRMTGMKCWLLIKTTRPASAPAILLTCSFALPFSSSYFLVISLHSVSSVTPLVWVCAPLPFRLRLSPCSPHVSLIFILPPIPPSFLIPFRALSACHPHPPPPRTHPRTHPAQPQLPRLRSGERVGRVGDEKRGRQRRCC